MKLNKNNMQNLTLMISAMGLMLTMLLMITKGSIFIYNDIEILQLAIALTTLTSFIYAILSMKRINPKKYIYLSYAGADKEIANKIFFTLSEQFKKLSKYRFEIITMDCVPFGNDMYIAMQENMLKSDIVIIIVSSAYLQSEWCLKEFIAISNEDKRMIPIVTESFYDLTKLPKNISNIKALSLINCESEESFSKALLVLAEDLIKQRKD